MAFHSAAVQKYIPRKSGAVLQIAAFQDHQKWYLNLYIKEALEAGAIDETELQSAAGAESATELPPQQWVPGRRAWATPMAFPSIFWRHLV